jgi:tetratricopeptide (TPR) repeat protein/predicted Ser/Thr protein kinase
MLRPTVLRHLDEAQALDLLNARLSDADATSIRAHAFECEPCREFLATLAAVLAPAEEQHARIGRYVLGARIGAGGMGEVWTAHDPVLDRDVAVKWLRADLSRSRMHSIAREAEVLASLSHPNIVAALELVHEGTTTALVMELVDGSPLHRWQRIIGRSVDDILACYLGAAEGLACAHAAGVVHGDFKPHNVVVDRHGRARVVDFGLAAWLRRSESDDRDGADEPGGVTTRGGTPPYTAPEVDAEGRGTPRADQFSFCVALWEALAGVRPFADADPVTRASAIAAGRTTAPARPLPRRISRPLLRGLRADPSERFPDMRALVDALERARRPSSSVRLLSLAVGVGIVAAFAGEGVDDECEHQRAAMAEIWNEDVADDIASALAHATTDDVSATNLAGGVSRRVDEWHDELTLACVHTNERGALQCLAEQRESMASFVDRSRRADGALRETTIAALDALPRARDCRATLDTPAASALAADVRLAIADTAVEIVRLPDATTTTRARALLAQAQALESTSLVGFAHVVHASALFRDGEAAAALAEFELGYLAATRSGDRELVADAAKGATMAATALGRYTDARLWLRHFSAAVSESDTEAQAELAVLGSDIARDLGERDLVEAELSRALAIAAPDNLLRGRILSDIARWRLEQGRFEEGLAGFEAALEFYETHLGPQADEVVSTLEGIGISAAALHRDDVAEAAFARALPLVEARHGTDSLRYDQLISNYSQVLSLVGENERALALLLSIKPGLERRLGPNNPELARLLQVVAGFEVALERFADAERSAQASIDRYRENGIPPPFQVLASRATALAELARVEPALAAWDEALAAAVDDVDRERAEAGRARVRLGAPVRTP